MLGIGKPARLVRYPAPGLVVVVKVRLMFLLHIISHSTGERLSKMDGNHGILVYESCHLECRIERG